MKKVHLTLLALAGSFVMQSCNQVKQTSQKSIDMPEWQWTSGELKIHDTAFNKAFDIKLNLNDCKEGDKVKVTFNSYKITLGGFTPGTTYNRWKVKVSLLRETNQTWAPLVADTNNSLNKYFTNVNTQPSDSLTNYSFSVPFPKDSLLHITVSPRGFVFDTINGHGKPMFMHGDLMVTTTIKGLKVEKE